MTHTGNAMKPLHKRNHPLKDSPWLANPIETHTFEGKREDDYYCRICNRPRALHIDPKDSLYEKKTRN